MNMLLLYFILILAAGIIIVVWYNYKDEQSIKRKIALFWGKEPEEKYTEEILNNISKFFKNKKATEDFFIDDITWNDLDLDDIFKKINSSLSSPGEEYLYSLLRTPVFKKEELIKRDFIISFFQNNKDIREKIQFALGKFGKNRLLTISDYIYDDEKNKNISLSLYRVAAFIPLLSFVLFKFNSSLAGFLLALSLSVNTFIHFKIKNTQGYKFQAFMYIISMANTAEKIAKINVPELKNEIIKVNNAIKNIKSVKSTSFTIISESNDTLMLIEYFKILFLIDVLNFKRMQKAMIVNQKDFIEIYNFVGMIDSFIALSSFRESLPYYSKPIFSEKMDNIYISSEDIYHPLVKKPVENSFNFNGSVLITGSNASGKSTFLKTVALNAILSQSIYTCTAKNYSTSFFKTLSSMALKDNIFSKESYYIVEIKSLKRIIDNLNEDIPILCFIDEILRGTNTIERISASSEVLNYISSSNCICIAATHDVELTHILENKFNNYHFRESIIDNEIIFDYKLHQGRTVTRNAIKLLNFMGYKEDIVKSAENRAEHFLKEGIWSTIQD